MGLVALEELYFATSADDSTDCVGSQFVGYISRIPMLHLHRYN